MISSYIALTTSLPPCPSVQPPQSPCQGQESKFGLPLRRRLLCCWSDLDQYRCLTLEQFQVQTLWTLARSGVDSMPRQLPDHVKGSLGGIGLAIANESFKILYDDQTNSSSSNGRVAERHELLNDAPQYRQLHASFLSAKDVNKRHTQTRQCSIEGPLTSRDRSSTGRTRTEYRNSQSPWTFKASRTSRTAALLRCQ
jgi:hypothetical protein